MKVHGITASVRNRISFFALVVLLVAAGNARTLCAASTLWPSQYLNGVAPDIRNAKLALKTRELGFDNYAVMHSGVTLFPEQIMTMISLYS